ncbi:MAG: hypothetical protein WA117_22050 [Verrucomicrobiia bacterium]
MGIEFFLGADPAQFAPIAQDARTDVRAARPDERAILHGDFSKLFRALQQAEDVWLDPLVLDPAKLLPLRKLYPPEQMEFRPVSQIVNSPANDTPACLVPTSHAVQLKS